VELIESNPYRPTLKPFKAPKSAGKATEHEMFACISDAHYPEVVDPAQTFGLKYNPDIAKKRIEYLRDKIIRYGDLRRTAYPVRKLTVNINGDMISGDIHEELEVTNAVPITQSMVDMSYILFDLGLALRESFQDVEFIVMPGNHPRLQKTPRFKEKWNNWEWVMGKMIQALAGDKFTVTVPKDLVYQFNIFDKRVGVTHGDGQKVQSYAGIPWYGMEKRRTKLQALLKQLKAPQLDLLVYGHFHQLIFEEGQGCSLLINGSIKGGDEYTTGAMYAAQAPVQALLTFHPRHGVTDLSRINLGHIND
jgi:predicted phosphodiesterase